MWGKVKMDSNSKEILLENKLTEEQKLKKKSLLYQMQEEIKELEIEIKSSRYTNMKVLSLRFLKVILRTVQLFIPYVLTTSLTFGACSFFGITPFYRDELNQKLATKKELDNRGNIRYEEQYEAFQNSENIISYYGKWSSSGDGFYSRDVEVYSIGEFTEEYILDLIEKDITSIEEVLGSPISKKIERKNNVTEEELREDAFIQAIIFTESDTDFIVVKESVHDNNVLTILWVIVNILVDFLVFGIRAEVTGFDYVYCLKKIKEKHPLVDIGNLKKKLEIKRNNYDRLTR